MGVYVCVCVCVCACVQGALLMLLGFAIQFHSHYILAHLPTTRPHTHTTGVQTRSTRSSSGVQTPSNARPTGVQTRSKKATEGYVVPQGGLFGLVSCPHYLGEVVIYLGLAVLCWPEVKPCLMLLWVVSAR